MFRVMRRLDKFISPLATIMRFTQSRRQVLRSVPTRLPSREALG